MNEKYQGFSHVAFYLYQRKIVLLVKQGMLLAAMLDMPTLSLGEIKIKEDVQNTLTNNPGNKTDRDEMKKDRVTPLPVIRRQARFSYSSTLVL